MARYTDKGQKKSIYKYLSKKAEIKVWLEPEHKSHIQEAAAKSGASVNAFILDAVNEKLASMGVSTEILCEASQGMAKKEKSD